MGGLGKKSTAEQHETVTLCGSGTTGCHGYVHSHDISLQKIQGDLLYTILTHRPLEWLTRVGGTQKELTKAQFYGVDAEDLY